MSLGNKTFKNNTTGELVKVIDSFENIAILENKQKADVSQLLNPELYTEQIDPKNFFNNQGAYNNLAEKIKSIPADKIRDDDGGEVMINVDGNNSFGGAKPAMNESAIIMTTEEEERAELAKKYGVTTPQNDVAKQNQAFAKLLGEEEVQIVEVNRDVPRVEQKVYQPRRQLGTCRVAGKAGQVRSLPARLARKLLRGFVQQRCERTPTRSNSRPCGGQHLPLQ